MDVTDIPTRFPVPFANSAGPTYSTPIPQSSPSVPGRASLDTGYPPETFTPVGAGGTPPFGQDTNGILNQATAAIQWSQAGGLAIYNAAFQTAIGGYPKGAVVQSALIPAVKWISSVDNNATNPDTGGAGWAILCRERLTANRTYYVATTGNDTNDGLTVGTPFATVQHAYDVTSNTLDLAGFAVVIQMANGTYGTTNGTLQATITPLGGSVTLRGDVATPANVFINVTSGAPPACIYSRTTVQVEGISFQSTTGTIPHLQADQGGRISHANCVFGPCTSSHLVASNLGSCVQNGPYSISGGASSHWNASSIGEIIADAHLITVVGVPAFSVAFAFARGNASINSAASFTGSATGSRYAADFNGTIYVNGAGPTYLPGNAAGTTPTGGQYG